jgi:hypothetical protein
MLFRKERVLLVVLALAVCLVCVIVTKIAEAL